MEDKKSIYFQRTNSKPPSSEAGSDSEDESFSSVFKLKKSKSSDQDALSRPTQEATQVDWKHLKSQLKSVDTESLTSDEKSESDSSEITDEIYEKIAQCPLCLKKIQGVNSSWKVNHLKQCSVKHEVTTRQLLKALKMQIKQFEEREALGLPSVSSDRPAGTRRTNSAGNNLMKQMSSKDPSIQLALAMSASLQEAQEAAIIKETSNLFEAGLETEAMECAKTLETLPVNHLNLKQAPSKKDKKLPTVIPVLLTRSKDDRERHISEKVECLVLLGEELPLPSLPAEPYELKSKTLKKVAIPDAQSWTLSQIESSDDMAYYTEVYLKCASPEKITTCVQSSKSGVCKEKQYSEVEQKILLELETLVNSMKVKHVPAAPSKTSSLKTSSSCSSTINTKENKRNIDPMTMTHAERNQMNELRMLSKALGSMIGKQACSDLTIYTREEKAIPCHKVILMSRIPFMLKDIIQEDSGESIKEMLMWNMERDLCLLVLKYLYSGVINHDAINKLDESQLNDLKQFCATHRIRILTRVIENIEADRCDDGKSSEHFDDLTSEQDTEDSSKPNSLATWLDKLKGRESTWRNNFRQRFNKKDNKFKLDCFEKTNSNMGPIDYGARDDGIYNDRTMDHEITDSETVPEKAIKDNKPEAQSGDEKVNETISADDSSSAVSSLVNKIKPNTDKSERNYDGDTYISADDSSSAVSSVVNKIKPNTDKSKGNYDGDIYLSADDSSSVVSSVVNKIKPNTDKYKRNYDNDIYDLETLCSSKTSDTDQISNSDVEVRQSLKTIPSLYEKNTLSSSSESSKSIGKKFTPVKQSPSLSQQPSASPELFSDSDEDNNRNVLNIQNGKPNTQANLHRLITLMEDDIRTRPEEFAHDGKKRKRSPSQTALDKLKRSKQTSSPSSSRGHCSSAKVNEIYSKENTNKEQTNPVVKRNTDYDFTTNLSTETDMMPVPCVAGSKRKSRITSRNIAIDFDKIEVDTSAPRRQLNTMNLTEENVMLFNEMNDKSNDSLPLQRRPSPDTSSHGSSLFFETYMDKYKDNSKNKSAPPLPKDKSSQSKSSKSYPLISQRKKPPTPDFLKAKFAEMETVEIKSSSDEHCYPTKALSQQYQFSQKLKKHKLTPPKRRSHTQPQKKSITPRAAKRLEFQKRFGIKKDQDVKFFPSDSSSDELTTIIKRKPSHSGSFEILSPIARVNVSHVPPREIRTSVIQRTDVCSSTRINETRPVHEVNKSYRKSTARDSISPILPIKSNTPREVTIVQNTDLNSKRNDSEETDCSTAPSIISEISYPPVRKRKFRKTRHSPRSSFHSPKSNSSITSDDGFEETVEKHRKTFDVFVEKTKPIENITRSNENPPALSACDNNSHHSNQDPGILQEDAPDPKLSRPSRNQSELSPHFSPRYIWDDPDFDEILMLPDAHVDTESDVMSTEYRLPSAPVDYSPIKVVVNDPDFDEILMLPGAHVDTESDVMSTEYRLPSAPVDYSFDSPIKVVVNDHSTTDKSKDSLYAFENEVQTNIDKSLSEPKDSHTLPKDAPISFETNSLHAKLSRLSQPLQNSQFMKKCQEYFQRKSEMVHKNEEKQINFPSELKAPVTPSKTTEQSSNRRSLPLSPLVIINRPVLLLDDSSNESSSGKRFKHFTTNTDIIDIVNVDSDHSNDAVQGSLSQKLSTYASETPNLSTKSSFDKLQLHRISSSDSENSHSMFSAKDTVTDVSPPCSSLRRFPLLSPCSERDTAVISNKSSPIGHLNIPYKRASATVYDSSSNSEYEGSVRSKETVVRKRGVLTECSFQLANSLSPQIPDSLSMRSSIPDMKSSSVSENSNLPHSPERRISFSHSQPSTRHVQLSQPSTSYAQHSQPSIIHAPPSTISALLSQPSTSYAQPSISNVQGKERKKSARRSLTFENGFDQLLEESLHMNESHLNRLESEAVSKTPVGRLRKSLNSTSSTVTPLADYSAMETPLLKKELNKYGLKPSLGKNKAKLMLRHIYDQTYPYVDNDQENPAPKRRKQVKGNNENSRQLNEGKSNLHNVQTSIESKRSKQLEGNSSEYNVNTVQPVEGNSNRDGPGTSRMINSDEDSARTSGRGRKKIAKKDNTSQVQKQTSSAEFQTREREERPSDGAEDSSGTEESIGSQMDMLQVYEESILFENDLNALDTEESSQVSPQFPTEVDKILRSGENYKKILCYEPLWLEHLHKELKERGVKSNLKQLMNYLDEKCITFRTTRKQPSGRQGAKSRGRKLAQPQASDTRPRRGRPPAVLSQASDIQAGRTQAVKRTRGTGAKR